MDPEIKSDTKRLNGLNVEIPDQLFPRLLEVLRPLTEERCMLLTGVQSGHQSGAIADAVGALEQLSVIYDHYKITESGASITSARLATKAFKRNGANFIIAIGGGSVLSTAKFIASSPDGGQVSVPLILLPTSPGFGAFSARVIVLMDHFCKHCISIPYTLQTETVLLNADYFETLSPAVSIPAFLACLVSAAEFVLSGGIDLYPECQSAYLRLLVQIYRAWQGGIKPYLDSFSTSYLKKHEYTNALVASALEIGLLQSKLGIGLLVYLGSAVAYRFGSDIGKSAALFLAPLLRLREESLGKEIYQLYESVEVKTVDELGEIVIRLCNTDGEGCLKGTNELITDIALSIDHVLPLIPYGPIINFEVIQLLEAGLEIYTANANIDANIKLKSPISSSSSFFETKKGL